jgi:hypothetical protein
MWRPRHDEGEKFISEECRITSRYEYRHILCYGTYHATTDPALETIMDAIRPETYSSQKEADASVQFDATRRTHKALCSVHEEKLTYLRRFKCNKLFTWVERVTERLVYSRFFDTHAGDRSANGSTGSSQHSTLESQPTRRSKGTSVNPIPETTRRRRQPYPRRQGRPSLKTLLGEGDGPDQGKSGGEVREA